MAGRDNDAVIDAYMDVIAHYEGEDRRTAMWFLRMGVGIREWHPPVEPRRLDFMLPARVAQLAGHTEVRPRAIGVPRVVAQPSVHAAARYLNSRLDPLARALFPAADDPILEYRPFLEGQGASGGAGPDGGIGGGGAGGAGGAAASLE
ncbi:MAG: hypothetical protein ABGY41_10610, partial [Candidatus Poribacteria bacterium]